MVLIYFFLWIGYLGLLILAGVGLSSKVKNAEDFFLASRSLSSPRLAFSLTISWVGATSVLITTDEAYLHGLSALWLVGIPAWLTVLIMAFSLTGPIRRWDGIPLVGLLEKRYGVLVKEMANILITWYMILLAASQLVALGNFLRLFLKQNYLLSLVAGLLAVLIYATFGGLFSVVKTDLWQSVFLFAGLLAIFFFLLSPAPHAAIAEAFFLPAGLSSLFSLFPRNGLAALSFVLAWLVSPIAWQRVQAARSLPAAKAGLFLSAGLFALVYPLLVAIGILSRGVVELKAEKIPLMVRIIDASFTPFWLKCLLFVTIVAAVVSTFDTAVNSSALFLSREIIARKKKVSGSEELMVSRLATIFVAGIAFLVATRFESILETIGLASEIMAEGLFFPAVTMLFLRHRAPLAGFFSLSAGMIFSFGNFLSGAGVLAWPFPPWPFSLPFGLGVSILGWVVGYLVAKTRKK